MKKHVALLIASLTAVSSALAASYSTEATITPHNDKSAYEVIVRVAHLIARDGKVTEEVVAQLKIHSPLGTPASSYSGLQPTHQDYQKEDNVTAEVSWPRADQGGTLSCTVTVRRGDKIVSKSKLQLKVDGP